MCQRKNILHDLIRNILIGRTAIDERTSDRHIGTGMVLQRDGFKPGCIVRIYFQTEHHGRCITRLYKYIIQGLGFC